MFKNPEEDLALQDAEYVPPDGYTEEKEETVELSKDEIKIKFWLYIEIIVFFANVASNMIFMLYRSCSKARVYSSAAVNNNEGIEKHQLLVSLCSAFFCPLVATASIILFPMRWEKDDDSDGSSYVYVMCMLITQLVQTILIHTISFTSYYREN